MEGGFLIFTKRVSVLLNVHEIPEQSISFEDVRHKDFKVYQGAWKLQSSPQGELEVVYSLEAKQNFSAPLAGDFMKGSIKDLLSAVRKEIVKRQTQKARKEALALLSSPGQERQSCGPKIR